MSGIAFYAPLKSPRHPTPSGDRQIARNLMRALAEGTSQQVTLASELRSFDKTGDPALQATLLQLAEVEATRLRTSLAGCALWVSYHNYYKAPDLIGPIVSRALKIPYVLIEATRAKKRLTGPWAGFARRAEAASDAADTIFHFTEHDHFALDRDRVAGQAIVALPPFLDQAALPAPSDGTGGLLCVGMMRHGDKLASYALCAEALAQVAGEWRLDIVGDGAARAEVEALFAPFGPRVRFHGKLEAPALGRLYAKARALIWPGVNEAFGMVYLEAQAHGVPVIAQDRPGVRDVLAPASPPRPEAGATALAQQIDQLLADQALWTSRAAQAAHHVEAYHLRPAAARRLAQYLQPLMAGAA